MQLSSHEVVVLFFAFIWFLLQFWFRGGKKKALTKATQFKVTSKSIPKWWDETFTEEKVVSVLLITRLQQSEAYEFSRSLPADINQCHSYQLYNQPTKLRCLNLKCKLEDIIYADNAGYLDRTTSMMTELPWAGPYLILCKCHALGITMLLILFIFKGNRFLRYTTPFLLSRTTEPLMVTYTSACYPLTVALCVYIK